MAQTVTECLAVGTDSVTLINDINTNGSSSERLKAEATQAEINEVVQRNVDHLSTILLYAPDAEDASDETPNVAGAASNLKTTHVAAISTGKTYITDNS